MRTPSSGTSLRRKLIGWSSRQRLSGWLLVAYLFALPLTVMAAPLVNRLAHHPSPYLALHGADPVAWQEWNPATITLARQQNKLLFVSIGYFSCHWCHVMQQESYSDPRIAEVLNRDFIPVKVDRELNAALDAEMIEFSRNFRGVAGWPLNVFITPEGYPLYATLYSKPDQFLSLITQLSERWQAGSQELKVAARKTASSGKSAAAAPVKPSPDISATWRKRLVEETLAMADPLRGGLDQARKFPIAPQLASLLQIQERHPDERLAAWLTLTLDRMMKGGLRDHVGGGFFRYTVDPDWHTPHYEKMLYDNAQLALLYLRAARVLGKPQYREIAFETLDFMLAEMRDAKTGAFIASTSAVDGEGREGGVYLWSKEQLRHILSPDQFALASRVWGLEAAAESDLGYLPQQMRDPTAAELTQLEPVYRKLREVRRQRHLPKDDKLLAGLNGLALKALSEAAAENPRYRRPADEVKNFLARQLWQKDGLRQGIGKGKLFGSAELEGYAYAATGLRYYARLNGKAADHALADKLALEAWRRFHSARGFRLAGTTLLASENWQANIADGAIPSPSAELITASLASRDKTLRRKGSEALGFTIPSLGRGLFMQASLVATMDVTAR
ncbi:MAG: DUF255 domain-containing protein [Gammaproteobacteria bacterium]|nr:DUF255 domain-containing protein [Gammaproteobacteria bacterium]